MKSTPFIRPFLRVVVALSFLLASHTVFAQEEEAVTSTTPLFFPVDLDSVTVDSFYAKRNIDLRHCHRPMLYFEIFRWYNTCYRWGGSTKAGVDCANFVSMLYANIYTKQLPKSSVLMFPLCRALRKKEDPKEGDLVFFNIRGKKLSHVGIYLQNGNFAHASVHGGVIISNLDEPYYKKYFYKFGRPE